MFYVKVTREAGRVVAASIFTDDMLKAIEGSKGWPKEVENRNDWKTFEAAEEIAKALGEGYVASDAGPYVSPRYDVIDLPKVGAPVSYAFNGDYYPCGTVKSISPGPGFRRIVAGPDFSGKDKVFWRRCQEGKPVGSAWVNAGTWSLVPGTISKTNPEF